MKYTILLLFLVSYCCLYGQATEHCSHQYLIYIQQAFELTTQERPDYKKALEYYEEAEQQAKKCNRKDLSLLKKGRAILLDRIMTQYQAMMLTTFGNKEAIRQVERSHADLIGAFDFDEHPLALVCKEGQFGYVRKTGQLAVDHVYKIAAPFTIQYFAQAQKEPNGPIYLIDSVGRSFRWATKAAEVVPETTAYLWTDDDEGIAVTTANKQLEVLRIELTLLDDLPQEVGTLTQLKHLDLNFCTYQELPTFIGNLTALEYLDLELNKLQTLPNEMANLQSLHYLNLTNNDFNHFPEVLFKLKGLRHLCMDKTPTLMAQKSTIEAAMPWCTIHWQEGIRSFD